MPNFTTRSGQAELMDDPALSQAEFEACLNSLERVNICTLAYRPTLLWLSNLVARSPSTASLSVMDIGSGGGDMLRRVWAWGRQRDRTLDLTGVDLNPWSKTLADARIPAQAAMRFETCDLFDLSPDVRPDVIISSLFTHHLSDAALVRFLQWMEVHARRGWFINDLHRHAIAYYFIRFVTALFRMNHIVQHDAPVSVARAFQRRDWEKLLAEAGIALQDVHIRWRFPFRYCVERIRP